MGIPQGKDTFSCAWDTAPFVPLDIVREVQWEVLTKSKQIKKFLFLPAPFSYLLLSLWLSRPRVLPRPWPVSLLLQLPNFLDILSLCEVLQGCPWASLVVSHLFIYLGHGWRGKHGPQNICGGQGTTAGVSSLLLPRESWVLNSGVRLDSKHHCPLICLDGFLWLLFLRQGLSIQQRANSVLFP